jgi:hypothetical protein
MPIMNMKNNLIGGGLIIIILLISYKFYNMSNTIEEQEKYIERLNVKKLDLEVKLTLEKANVNELQKAIDITNDSLDILNKENEKILKEFNTWKNKPPVVKYKTKVVEKIITNKEYVKGECEEGILLNKSISELKYEDL